MSQKNYTSDENVFTRSVKSILQAKTSAIQAKTSAIQKAITDQVDVKFKEDAIKFAVTKLAERLGLK